MKPLLPAIFILAQFSVTSLQAKVPPGVAALVNGQPISLAELDRDTMERLRQVSTVRRSTEDDEKVLEMKRRILDVLIDRILIIQKFHGTGEKIPDGKVDERVADIVRHEFGGDRAAFNNTLAARGVSEAAYRQEIADNFSVSYMELKYVKTTMHRPANSQPGSGPDSQPSVSDWIRTLRRDAKIEIADLQLSPW